MIKTSDGGFLFCGQAVHDNSQKFAAFLLKTKANGDLEWQKFYGGISQDAFQAVRQTFDGGYIAVGFTTSYGFGSATQRADYWTDAWMVKTDANGNQMWMKTFGNIYGDEFLDIVEMPDHGFLAVGVSTDTISKANLNYSAFCYVVRTDQGGTPLWKHEYFKSRDQGWFYSISVASNGDMAMAGVVDTSGNSLAYNIFVPCLLNLSSDGKTVLDSTVYPQYGNTTSEKILAEPDGFALCFNVSKDNSNTMCFLKTSFDGTISWQKPFVGLSFATIADAPNGGYFVTATNGTKGSQLLQIDASGGLVSTINCDNGSSVSGAINPAKTNTIGAISQNDGWAFGVSITPAFINGNGNFALIFTDLNGKIKDEGK